MPEQECDTTLSWRTLTAQDPAPHTGSAIIPWRRWGADHDAWIAWRAASAQRRLGVMLGTEVAPDSLSIGVEHVDLVIVEVPSFADGRAFSIARMLRERHGFRGELRASGDLLADQVSFLERCGFDSFDSAYDLRTNNAGFSGYYQPAARERRTAAFIRAARRASASEGG